MYHRGLLHINIRFFIKLMTRAKTTISSTYLAATEVVELGLTPSVIEAAERSLIEAKLHVCSRTAVLVLF